MQLYQKKLTLPQKIFGMWAKIRSFLGLNGTIKNKNEKDIGQYDFEMELGV